MLNMDGVTVGGEGTTVQIDKSKFGKRKKTKSGRGHRVVKGHGFLVVLK
jgi:hypothetical protein